MLHSSNVDTDVEVDVDVDPANQASNIRCSCSAASTPTQLCYVFKLKAIATSPHACEKAHRAQLRTSSRPPPCPGGATTSLAIHHVPLAHYVCGVCAVCAPQVLAFDASSSPAGRGSSRYLFAETDRDDGGTARRFLALDYRGDLGGEDGGARGGTAGWALGTGSDGNGALGLGQPAELSR